MNYIKICPKCESTMVKSVFDKEKKRVVSKCLNCSFKGDELFPDVEADKVIAKYLIRSKGWR